MVCACDNVLSIKKRYITFANSSESCANTESMVWIIAVFSVLRFRGLTESTALEAIRTGGGCSISNDNEGADVSLETFAYNNRGRAAG